tara:strand:- start:1593 stop:1955 length:363 start_codon:yes stop_codon:yes gene_type:complete
MRKLIFTMLLVSGMVASAADMSDESLMLKDGATLITNDDGTMNMKNKDGDPVAMKNGVAMELEDGSLIMMKNKKVWRHNHRKMKGMGSKSVEVEMEDGSVIMLKDEKVWRDLHRKHKGMN